MRLKHQCFLTAPQQCQPVARFENPWCGACGLSTFLVYPLFLPPAILSIPNRQHFSYVVYAFWHMIFSSRRLNGMLSNRTLNKSFSSPSLNSTKSEFNLQWTSLLSIFILSVVRKKCVLFLVGILYKGNGENQFISQQPPVVSSIMGNGRRRSISCPSCNGQADGNKLLAPVALACGIDGSLYVGDFNYVRRIFPSGNVTSVLELRYVFP